MKDEALDRGIHTIAVREAACQVSPRHHSIRQIVGIGHVYVLESARHETAGRKQLTTLETVTFAPGLCAKGITTCDRTGQSGLVMSAHVLHPDNQNATTKPCTRSTTQHYEPERFILDLKPKENSSPSSHLYQMTFFLNPSALARRQHQ